MPPEIVSPSLAVLSLTWLMFTVSFPPAGMKVTRAVFPSRTVEFTPPSPTTKPERRDLSCRGSIILKGSHLVLVVGCVCVCGGSLGCL